MNKVGLRALIIGTPSVPGAISTPPKGASAAKKAKRKAQKRARQITRRRS